MKINKNTLNKKSLKYIMLIVIFIIVVIAFIIYKYSNYCLIYYVENEPTSKATVWNTAVTVRVKVLNNGTLIDGYGNEKEKLEEDKLKEIRQLVSQLKEKVKGLEENNTAADKFTINNKTYSVNLLDSEGKKTILQIRNIVY